MHLPVQPVTLHRLPAAKVWDTQVFAPSNRAPPRLCAATASGLCTAFALRSGRTALAAKKKKGKKKKGGADLSAVAKAKAAMAALEAEATAKTEEKKAKKAAAQAAQEAKAKAAKEDAKKAPEEAQKAPEPAPEVVAKAPEPQPVAKPAAVPKAPAPAPPAPAPPARAPPAPAPKPMSSPALAAKEPAPSPISNAFAQLDKSAAADSPSRGESEGVSNAFATLAGLSAPPRDKAPKDAAGDELLKFFDKGGVGKAPVDTSGFLADAQEVSRARERRRKEAEAARAEAVVDEADAEEEEILDEDEDDDDEDELPEIKRRRGTEDLVSFEMETGGRESVAVGLKSVALRLGGRMVLQDASWMVKTGDRMALVGANGCGKTSQLRVLTGEHEPDAGDIFKSQPDVKLAVLSQGFVDELDPERTLKQELMAAVPKEEAALRLQEQLQEEIEILGKKIESEESENVEDAERMTELLDRLADVTAEVDELKCYDLDKRMDGILAKVGFLPEDLSQQVGLFSGGWKVRIGLSKIFMTAPDVLLLDEPTNHLDLNSVEWLEGFLQKQTLPIVLVSHDREFIDRICNRVVETVDGMTYSYNGNYTDYVKERDAKLERWEKKWTLQERQVEELETFIRIHKGEQLMSQARKNKIRELEKLRASDNWVDPPPRYATPIKFLFPDPPQRRRGSRKIEYLASMRKVSHGYGEEGGDSLLFEDASFEVGLGEKIGIVGPNGAGKSTLLRLLLGQEEPKSIAPGGELQSADPSSTCYFTQHQADLLPPDMTALEVADDANRVGMDQTQLYLMMKKFRFRGPRLNIKCKDLSGGEKARLAIVRMMLTPSRMLVLDEPTNHLDVPMKETLEYSLREYPGAVVVVSHDRWFLSQTCQQIVSIQDKTVKRYNGDFRHYMDSNRELKRQIEKHYQRNSIGIDSVPLSRNEARAAERKGLKKYSRKRKYEDRKAARQKFYEGPITFGQTKRR